MSDELKDLAVVEYGKSPNQAKDHDGEYPIYGTSGLVGYANAPLFSGDGVVVARKGTLDNPTFVQGKYWVIDTAYIAQPKDGVDAKWLYYCLDDYDLRRLNEATGVPSISRDYLYRVEFYKPKYNQQKKIAKILTTIDNLIKKTQSLIDKYTQIKQGMMTDLFTRGIDISGSPATNPNYGQLRPSFKNAPNLYKETELGWVPKEWEVKPLDECVNSDITYGIVQAGPHIEDGVPYIRTGDMSSDKLDKEKLLCTTHEIASSFKRSEIKEGEIVCAIRATVGKVLIVPFELDGANLTQGTARIAPASDIDNKYLLWSLRSRAVEKQYSEVIKGTTFMEITLAKLRKINIPVPCKEEQEQRIIGSKIQKIDDLQSKEIQILRKNIEIKKGLMQDLLTGKVKVV